MTETRIDAAAAPDDVLARHRSIYRGLVPRFAYWPAAPRVHAGRNPLSEHDVLELRGLGVTHVLDLRQRREWTRPMHGAEAVDSMPRHGIERLSLPIPDMTPPGPEDFTTASAWIADVLARPATRLYAHCRAGIQRTAAILTAWRAWSAGEEIPEALEFLRRQGWPADPLDDQRTAAERWLTNRRREDTHA